MTNLKQLNQSNPFWDWVTEMDKAEREKNGEHGDNGEGPSGKKNEEHDDYEEPFEDHVPDHADEPPPPFDDDKTPLGDEFDDPPSPPPPESHPPPGSRHPHGPHRHPHGHPHGPPRGHRGGWGGRGGHHPRGGPHGPHGHHGPRGPGFSGPWGGPHFGGPFGGPFGGHRSGWMGRGGHGGWAKMLGMGKDGFNMEALGQFMKDNFGLDAGQSRENGDRDFKPAADIFDTSDAYIIHVSLAGAKKEDLGVNWDPENSEISVAGVIHRPGDEEFLKTLALDERDIGAFERKIKLGSKAEPASVNADAMSARMEDGVLMITVPKREGFVEIKKVDIL